jgi:cellular nucleic acid-binding protein
VLYCFGCTQSDVSKPGPLPSPSLFPPDSNRGAPPFRTNRTNHPGHHFSLTVPHTTQAPKVKPCHLCGEANHLSRDCPHGLCFNCLRTGHRSRDCAEQRGFGRDTQSLRCLRCGGSGHGLTHCLENFAPKDLGRITCYVCGEQGHLCCAAQDCAVSCSKKDPKKNSCCRCGGVGHDDSECAQGRRGGGYQGGHVANQNCQNSQNVFACFKCGGNGHIARECPAGSSLPSGNEPVDLRHTLQGGGGNKSGGGVPQGGAGGPMRGNPGGSKYGGYAGGTGGFRNQNTTGAGAGGWASGGGGGGRGGWGGGGRGRGMGNDACMGRGRGGWSNGGKTGGKPRSGPY